MRRLYVLAYAVCLTAFGLLACLAARSSGSLPGDTILTNLLTGIGLPFIDGLLWAVSGFGETIPVIITVSLLVIMLLFFRRWLEALFMAVLPSVAALLTWLMKLLVDRARPGEELLADGGFSFPSGHSSYIVVGAGFLIYLLPVMVKQRVMATFFQVILAVLILLMMLSRIYLGEHWPSDILGGILLGVLILVPAVALYKKYAIGRKDA